MKCILHIGTEKIGSTAIQKWLYNNKNTLSDNKVFLSESLSKPNNRIFSLFFSEYFSDSTSFRVKEKVSTTPDLFNRLKQGLTVDDLERARAGAEYIENNHTWKHRIEDIVQIISK